MAYYVSADGFICIGQVFLYGEGGDAHDLGCHFIGASLDFYQLVYLFLLGGKLLDRSFENKGGLAVLDGFFDMLVPYFDEGAPAFLQTAVPFELAEKVMDQVLTDPVDIAGKVFGQTLIRSFLPDPGEEFLDHFFGQQRIVYEL